MRAKPSSPKFKNCLEDTGGGETQLSGSYIRSLVKQLTSARTKDEDSLDGDGVGRKQSFAGYCPDQKHDESNANEKQPTQAQHKKPVRRRLHTTRPYQERLLNMAEARKEIVAALKFHRAAMKQASDEQRMQQQQQHQGVEFGQQGRTFGQGSHQLSEAMLNSSRIPSGYCDANSSNHITLSDNYLHGLPGYCFPYSWPVSSVPPPPPQFIHENLNFVLPSQTLGLNLNLEDFNCLDTDAFHCSKKPCSMFSSSSSSSPISTTVDEIPCMAVPASGAAEVNQSCDWGSHHAMDDKELAEIKSIGEQHQMEWNDTLNLVNSAWWFKFSKTMEIERKGKEDVVESPFDEVMEFPEWLNTNEENCLEHVNDFFPQDCFPALPCMEIEEIEGMDGDWLV